MYILRREEEDELRQALAVLADGLEHVALTVTSMISITYYYYYYHLIYYYYSYHY